MLTLSVVRPSVRERFTFSTSPPRAISWIELNHSGCGGGGGGGVGKGGGEVVFFFGFFF